MGQLLFYLLRLVFLFVFPFFVLIRGAVYVHTHHGTSGYISLLAGVFICTITLVIYFTFIYERLTKSVGSPSSFKSRMIFTFLVVLAYCAHGLFFLSTDNMKNKALRSEVGDLHPIIRMAVSTFVIIDKKLIVTDAARQPEDYRKMGLPSKRNSLHYKQKDGYSYAIDLRTNNRSELRNIALSWYFKLMGLRTLRHVGTADHLHVSLHCPYLPYSR